MYELGKTIWSDDHPELYGEALDFEALANVKSNELLLYDDDATEPFGGVVCTLAEYTEHGVLLDTGGEKLTAVDRDELEEEAGIWRLKTDGLPETDENAEEMPMKETEMKPDENASETVPMLTEKQQAEALHKQITGYGEVIYQSLYGMCTAIKQMRDSKLYKALGHSTFESYAQEMLGMTASQTYRYIKIADNLSAEFVESTPQIGIQKLYLLAMAPEETRTEIVRQNDLTETTVKELREQIAALKEESDLDRKERDNANEAAQRWKNTAQSTQADNQRLEDQVQSLTDQVRELESRPVEVAVPDNDEELEMLAEEIDALREENAKLQAKSAESAAAGGRKDVYAVLRDIANDGLSRIDDYLRQSGDIDCRRNAAEMLRKYLERWKG